MYARVRVVVKRSLHTDSGERVRVRGREERPLLGRERCGARNVVHRQRLKGVMREPQYLVIVEPIVSRAGPCHTG